jgi:hypothetical protein
LISAVLGLPKQLPIEGSIIRSSCENGVGSVGRERRYGARWDTLNAALWGQPCLRFVLGGEGGFSQAVGLYNGSHSGGFLLLILIYGIFSHKLSIINIYQPIRSQ